MTQGDSFILDSREGLPIRVELHLPPRKRRGLVIIVHGFKGFKDWGMFPWLGESLCQSGFAAARFEMSRNGVGERPGEFDRLDLFADDTYSIERADLLTVAADLTQRFAGLPLSLVGHSRGAGVALLAAREIHDLRAAVTWNGISSAMRWDRATISTWRREGHLDVVNSRTGQVMRMSTAVLEDLEANPEQLDILAAARTLSVPLLILHGGSDESVPLAEGRQLAAAAANSSFVMIGRGTHTFGATHPFRHPTSELQLAAKLTTQFLLGVSSR